MYSIVSEKIVCVHDCKVFYPQDFTHCFMLYAVFQINETMFSATLSLNDPFSLQQIQHTWGWNHLHLCFPGLQNGECSSLHICSLASINIFPLTLEIQMFKGMFAFHSKLWLMVLQMQGSISLNVSYWYSISFLLRQLCPWCHYEHSKAVRARKPDANLPGIPAGFCSLSWVPCCQQP